MVLLNIFRCPKLCARSIVNTGYCQARSSIGASESRGQVSTNGRSLVAIEEALLRHRHGELARLFEFLSMIPAMEQAGLVNRVPNWWNAARPPRPQVSVNIGSKAPSRFGIDGLDLQVNVVIDGEPLSETELKQLLAAREGLLLLRGKWVQVDSEKLSTALQHWQELRKQHLAGVDFSTSHATASLVLPSAIPVKMWISGSVDSRRTGRMVGSDAQIPPRTRANRMSTPRRSPLFMPSFVIIRWKESVGSGLQHNWGLAFASRLTWIRQDTTSDFPDRAFENASKPILPN